MSAEAYETHRCMICGYKLDDYAPTEVVCGACIDTYPDEVARLYSDDDAVYAVAYLIFALLIAAVAVTVAVVLRVAL